MKLNKLFLAAALLVTGSLVSCGGNDTPATSNPGTSTQPDTSTPAPVAKKKARIALGYSINYQAVDAHNAEKAKNLGEFTVAALALDEAGKILDARFDVQQINVKITPAAEEGKFTFEPTTKNYVDGQVKSKLEMGKDYNMHLVFGDATIGDKKEVDVQIETYADYCVGKTIDQVLANEDDVAGVTISTGDFNKALESAKTAGRERDLVEYEGDLKVGVGMSNGSVTVNHSGAAEISTTFTAAAVVDNKAVAAFTDCAVITLGEVAKLGEAYKADAAANDKYLVNNVYTTKFDLHEKYGMLGQWGSSFAEWDQQGKNFDAAIVGKTAAQIAELELSKDNGGVTIAPDDMLQSASEAVKYATMEHVGPQW